MLSSPFRPGYSMRWTRVRIHLPAARAARSIGLPRVVVAGHVGPRCRRSAKPEHSDRARWV